MTARRCLVLVILYVIIMRDVGAGVTSTRISPFRLEGRKGNWKGRTFLKLALKSPKTRGVLRPKVALTRESSKNSNLHELILKNKLECSCVLLPVLEHSNMLENSTFCSQLLGALVATDVVVLTSPQAAMEFVKVWPFVKKKDLKFASIGKKTASILSQSGIFTDFSPSQETAHALGRELPNALGTNILYPTSFIAQNTMVDELQIRGFHVNRINIYDTYGANWDEDLTKKAKEVDIVTLTSPSAARAWVARAGSDYDAVVIGSTTLKTAESLDFASVTCVNNKGLDSLQGLVEGIRLVLQRKYRA